MSDLKIDFDENILDKIVQEAAFNLSSKIEENLKSKNIIDVALNSTNLNYSIQQICKNEVDNFLGNHIRSKISEYLRLGIYDATKVDKVFNEIWEKEFEVAVSERIKGKISQNIENVIREKLRSMVQKLTNV